MEKKNAKSEKMIEDFKSSQNQSTTTQDNNVVVVEKVEDKMLPHRWHVKETKEMDSKTKYLILCGVALAVVGAAAIIHHLVKE